MPSKNKNSRPRPLTWWACFNPYPEGDKPVVRHETFESAKAEAERLAVRTRRKIHVLKVVGTMHPPAGCFWENRDWEPGVEFHADLVDAGYEAGRCGDCGRSMTPVRPGKAQCDWCEVERAFVEEEKI